jgi:WD40 repeat protein
MLFKTNAVLTAVDPETLQEVGAQGFENPHEKGSYGFKVQFGNLSSDGVTAAMYIREDTNEIGSMDLFDLSRSRFLCSLKDVTSLKAAFAPKRHWIATGTRDRTVTLWQLPDGYRKLVLTNAESPLSFSADETMLATGAWNPGMTTVWKLDGPSAQRLCTIEINADCAAFSLNGTLLVTPDDSGFGGKLWSIPSGTPAGSFTGHTRPISQLSLSPDGRTLATVSDDGTLRLWQFATGRELMRFQMPRNDTDASWVLFSPDGRSLAAFTAIFDGALDGRFTRLWFAPSFDEISLAQGALPAQPRLTGPEWQVRAKALAQHGQFQQAIEGFGKVIELATGHPEWEALRVSALQHRSNLLRASSRLSEAAADNCAALRISQRDPRTLDRCIDLSAHFNGSLDLEPVNRVIPLPPFLEGVPRGIQVLDNVPFDLRGIIQINRKDGPTEVPVAVEGIPIRRKAACLHFLHATGWSEAENTLIGAYKIHYRDGTQQDVPLVYGKDLREWLCASDFADVPQARVIWSGYNSVRGPFRLFCRRWENPSPDVEIDSLDFVSNLTQCAPYLLAITADTAQGAGLAQTDR